MPQPLELRLSREQRRALERLRDTSPKPYVRERCAALLKVAAGHSGRAVARELGMRPRQEDTLYGWVHGYATRGLAGLLIRSGRGRKPSFSPSGRLRRARSGVAASA